MGVAKLSLMMNGLAPYFAPLWPGIRPKPWTSAGLQVPMVLQELTEGSGHLWAVSPGHSGYLG